MRVEQPPDITQTCFFFVLFLLRLPHRHMIHWCTLPLLLPSTPSPLSLDAPLYYPILSCEMCNAQSFLHPTCGPKLPYTLLTPCDTDSGGSSHRVRSCQPPPLTKNTTNKSQTSSSPPPPPPCVCILRQALLTHWSFPPLLQA